MIALLRLQLRTGWVVLFGWTLAWVSLILVTAASTKELYGTSAARAQYAATMELARASEAMNGRGYDLTTPGGIAAFEAGVFSMLLIPIGAALMAINRTRREEDAGRLDLVSAGPVPRLAPLITAGGFLFGVIVAFGIVLGAGLIALGLPLGGTFVYSLSLVCLACAFAALGLLVAQLASSSQVATSLGIGIIVICYLVRVVIDGQHWSTTWATPIGWVAEFRPWGEHHWWPLLAFAALTILLIALTLWLAWRRDLGDGVLAARPGPVRARRWLRGPWSWAWRLVRGSVLGWVGGGAILAACMASVGEEMRDLVLKNPELAALLGAAHPEDFVTRLALVMVSLSALSAGLGVWGRYRAEEAAGRLAMIEAGPVSRSRVWLSWLSWSVIASASVLAVGGLVLQFALDLVISDSIPNQSFEIWGSAFVALLVIVVGAGVLAAVAPRAGFLGWIVVAWVGIVGILAETLRLPEWAMALSPLRAIGNIPMTSPHWGVVFAFALVVLAFAGVGIFGVRRRDLIAG